MKLPGSFRVGRPFSLRARVALASAVTAAVVVGAMSAVLFAFAPNDARTQVVSVVSALAVTRADDGTATTENPVPGHTVVVPAQPAVPRRSPADSGTAQPAVPALPLSNAEFARTVPVDGSPVVLAVPQSVAADSITKQRLRIIAIGVAATVLAALLGWYLSSRAVSPLRRLTAATAGLGDRLELDPPRQPAASETAELADAMNTMLARISDERRHTTEALVTARDFAATAAHELRTPLTAMRTDLQVLRSMPMSESERTEIIDEVLTTQSAVESTLAALERLAQGDLTTESDWEELDLGEIIDQVVDDATRLHPAVTITTTAVDSLRLRGLAPGLRSVVENAVTNSLRHGAATRIDIAAHRLRDKVILTIDDNGTGIPAAARPRVFDRFYRASSSPGSGLGLALVAQQARLHNGTATIEDSPLGGVRLTVTLMPGEAAPHR
ncbi:sensor histidine kinase [Nocardia sp. NPDC088792]|uniref:sensor histidine kinase n=1 Tax=Nocardia sp. NPDC088792 TaxID=3364332 RepID=UPI0038075F01